VGRKLRFVPERGTLVEVTCRTVQGRFLLRPSPLLNDGLREDFWFSQSLESRPLAPASLLVERERVVRDSRDLGGCDKAGTSFGHFGFDEVYGKLGVLDLHQPRQRRRPAHALS
jgi:hypothetical protein